MDRLESHLLEPEQKHYVRVHALILRAILAVNWVLFVLSFWPRYAGTAINRGLADEWFGMRDLGGFRADFVWLGISTLMAAVAFFFFFDERKSDARAHVDILLCGGWVIACFVMVYHMAHTGILDFG
jgi:hypothetical protein